MPYVIGALVFLALAYRFYYCFIATKVLMLNDDLVIPSIRLSDKQNYYPMPRWVLFGHHFTAIAGAVICFLRNGQSNMNKLKEWEKCLMEIFGQTSKWT